MKYAINESDLIVILGDQNNGHLVPDDLSTLDMDHLRFDGKKLIDANTITKWLIDDDGRKRLPAMHPNSDWQKLDCTFDAELIRDQKTGVWRVKTDADMQKEAIEKAQAEFVANLRSQIAENVADTESLLGTVADASGVLVALSLARISALASVKASDLSVAEKAELATVQALAGDIDLAAVAADALAKLNSGDAVLTASVKGLDAVIGESLERSTAVSNIMVQSSEG